MSIDPVLIFFAALAAFLSYRLFTVLGTRNGQEGEERDMPAAGARDSLEARLDEPPRAEPRPAKPAPAWAAPVIDVDPGFEATHFVSGAKAAYEMIVKAFAAGDLAEVEPYIDPSVLKAFEVAVSGRTHAGQTMEVEFVGIEKADVVKTNLHGDLIEITVSFQSDQIRVMRNADGEVVDGDPNRIDVVRDTWTFTRDRSSRDPNWILTATDGAAPTAG